MKDIVLIKHRLQINISRAASAFGHDFIVVLPIKIMLNSIFFTEILNKIYLPIFSTGKQFRKITCILPRPFFASLTPIKVFCLRIQATYLAHFFMNEWFSFRTVINTE